MARTFTAASSEKITLALGAGGSLTAGFTLAAIFKIASDGLNRTILSISTDSNSRLYMRMNTSNKLAFIGDNSGNNTAASTSTILAADGWAFGAITRPDTGSRAASRFHIYKYATDTWVHESGSDLSMFSPTGSSGIGVAVNATNNFWNGDITIVGAWASNMTDAQVEPMAYGLNAWFQSSPNGLWPLDQSSTSLNVNDLTGNGANQSGITGTTVSTNNVPIFSYGHLPLVPTGIPSAVTVTTTTTTTFVTHRAGNLVLGRRSFHGTRIHSIRRPVGVDS